MREEALGHKLREIAREEVPAGADLWPAIVVQVEGKGLGRPHRYASRSRLLALSAATLALALFFAATGPAAMAKVSDMMQRFGMVLLSPDAARQLTQPTLTPSGGWSQPQQTEAIAPRAVDRPIEEVQRQVDFQIRTPTWLPDGVVFRGAMASSDGQGAVVSYRGVHDPNSGIGVQMRRGRLVSGYGVPSSATQEVQVHGEPAIYAQGAWTKDGTWNERADAGMLSWEDRGFTYYVSSSGLGLSREDLVRIAESLSP